MHWMDDAVTFYYDGRLEPGVVLDPYSIYPLEGPCTQSFDLAFELDTDPCYIKHEQAYDSLRHWPWYHDEYSFAWETIYTETVTKWIQEPDFTNTGIDVDATLDQFGGYPPQLLADDFLCTETEWITDIHIYGSWWRDRLPMGGETQVVFTLSLHPDIPAGVVEPWSIPGPPLWLRPFGPGEFGVDMVFQTPESYYMPCTDIFTYQDHTMAWRYDFYLPKGELLQEGTPDEPVIYWLNVQAMPLNASDPDVRFGWKTSLDHWQDNAVFGIGNEPYDGPWLQIMNPLTEITDLAFEITTEKEYTELQIDRLVADDWPCETNTPVSAIVFWGSYLEYFYEACQCFEPVPTPVPPDYFLLQIWTDVPAGVDEPFSHPDEVIWEYKAYDYDEVMVGYDKYPEGGGGAPGYEPVFRYSVRLPEDEYFCQQEPNSVYWLSVVAVYSESEPMYPWGWTNHEHMYNDDAVEGFFDGIEWTWNELFDQNEPPQSQDMSFVLFTGRTCWDLIECAGQPFGDSTCDGSVNFADLAALKMGWMKNQGQPGYNCCTDFTQDGSINFQELLILKMYWMTSGYTPSTKNQTCCP